MLALPMFILLPPEPPDEDDEEARDAAEREAEYHRNPPVMAGDGDPSEDQMPHLSRQRGGS